MSNGPTRLRRFPVHRGLAGPVLAAGLALAIAALAGNRAHAANQRLASAQLSTAQATPVRYRDIVFDRVARTDDIVYGHAVDIPTGQTVDLQLDLYEPEGDAEQARPVLLFIHGGGFVNGDKATTRRWTLEFARRGWVAITINYRLRQGDFGTVAIPAAVSDARQAMRWVSREAQTYRLDTDRVVVAGSSAGAITALFLSYTDLEKGPADEGSTVAGVMDLWGALYGQESEMTAGEPPLIIVHGTEDSVVPYRHAEALRDRAEEVGIPYAWHPLQGVGHGSGQTAMISAWTAEFFYPLLWPDQATPGPEPTGTTQATPTPELTPTAEPSGQPSAQPTAGPPTATPSSTSGPPPSATPNRYTILLPLAARRADLGELPPLSTPVPTAAPTRVPGTIDGCSPERLDLCAYSPATWSDTSSVRSLQGYTVTNKADGRLVPILVRYSTDATGKRPVVVWSHGGGPRKTAAPGMNWEWGVTLARAGYVVVHPAHVPGDQAALCEKLGVTDPQQCRAINDMTWYRATDARAVLDALPEVAAAFPELRGRLDLDRVAYAGHSFGAFTTMTVAGARVDYAPGHMDVSWKHSLPRAFIALSPQGPDRFGFHDGSWRDLDRPMLTASGRGDTTGRPPLGEQAADRRIPFRRMPPGDKYELWLHSEDAIHRTFSLSDKGPGSRFSQPIAMTAVAFLDAHVLDHRPARRWLASSNVVVLAGGEAELLQK